MPLYNVKVAEVVAEEENAEDSPWRGMSLTPVEKRKLEAVRYVRAYLKDRSLPTEVSQRPIIPIIKSLARGMSLEGDHI